MKTTLYNWQQIVPYFHKDADYLLMAHIRPDGDAEGSCLGLAIVLRSMGISARVLKYEKPKDFYWLPGMEYVEEVAKGDYELPRDSFYIVLDCGSTDRCQYFIGNKKPILNCDHHVTNNHYGILNWVDPEASSTCEVLTRLLMEENIVIPKDAATCFLLGMITDSGWFRFSSTSSDTLEAASYLLKCGADIDLIREHILDEKPRQEYEFTKYAFNHHEFVANNKATVITVTKEDMIKNNWINTESNEVMTSLRSIEGVEACCCLKEQEENFVRVSMRSTKYLDCSKLCSEFGGGGHVRAAGGTLHMSLVDAKAYIIGLLERELHD